MSITTVWTNANSLIQLVQLSDDPTDGTPQEQISHLEALSFLSGWSCVDPDFTGDVPDADVSLWRWSDGEIVSLTPVPLSVTPRQVRLLLLSQNLLPQVEDIIAASDEATKITWQYALEFRRDDPLLQALSQQLGLTSDQVDQFFIEANKL